MVYQVKLSPTGPWHRREVDPSGIGNGHTACGLPIDGAYLSREHVLDDRPCPVCFTHRERDTGEMKKIEKEALEIKRASELVEQWERERTPHPSNHDDEITDEHEPTGEHRPALPSSREESGEIDTDDNKKGGS